VVVSRAIKRAAFGQTGDEWSQGTEPPRQESNSPASVVKGNCCEGIPGYVALLGCGT